MRESYEKWRLGGKLNLTQALHDGKRLDSWYVTHGHFGGSKCG